jgi:Zn finger protein HypA/HybF involved in hydrogenase expression
MDPITLRSLNGRDVRVEFGMYTLSPREAFAFAFDLTRAASHAEAADGQHQRHVNLKASCPLCVYEAGSQTDRLEQDED